MRKKLQTTGFGLIIIGSEILDGRFKDSHFETAQGILAGNNFALLYTMILPDNPDILTGQLSWAMHNTEPFFCCGGIGGTPDDYTRQCAARAAGVETELHPEGARILEDRFAGRITPDRLKMVEFPHGAKLIPNPVNGVPGFYINNGYFLPGFPSMATPMMQWVVQTIYESGSETRYEKIILPGAKEADLNPLMEQFIAEHPELTFSSLPRFVEDGTEVELGIKGPPEAVSAGKHDLIRLLETSIPHFLE